MSSPLSRRSFLRLTSTLGLTGVMGLTDGSTSLASGETAGPLPTFIDIAARSGVSFKHDASRTSQKYLIEAMGSGVGVFDYDGDGYLDIFFVNGAKLADPMPSGREPDKSDRRFWNRLYHNDGNGRFTDVTEKAGLKGTGYGMGLAVADCDNDGRPDLYVINVGQNTLYHNNGDGTFTDITRQAGVAAGGWSTGACFVDYDRDGHLDLLVTRYLEWSFETNPFCGKPGAGGYRGYCPPDKFKPIAYVLYHNNGNGTFTDVTKQSGFAAAVGKGLGVTICDFDRDGWPDLVVANDTVAQQLFKNNRNGTFTEVGLALGMAYDDNGRAYAGMGVDCQDYDNDGWPDIFINALSNQTYALYHNNKGTFDDVTAPSGLAAITALYSGWGAKFLDYDNDGWKDLFVAQGHVLDQVQLEQPDVRYLEPMLMLRNAKGRFANVSARSGEPFEVPRAGRGAAVGDLDNDGRLEIVVNCNDEPAVVLHSDGGFANHWLTVDTRGTVSNRDGIGTAIRLVSESGAEQYGMVNTAGSYLSASDKRVHFGLGADRRVRLLEVTWPSGTVQRIENIAADQVLRVQEPERSAEHTTKGHG
ncbi:MAG TPA: CRTAC1 family protein [Terriglobia bacterium]|nr:CRTAC1 family protein [Terriglobia bacterium]